MKFIKITVYYYLCGGKNVYEEFRLPLNMIGYISRKQEGRVSSAIGLTTKLTVGEDRVDVIYCTETVEQIEQQIGQLSR